MIYMIFLGLKWFCVCQLCLSLLLLRRINRHILALFALPLLLIIIVYLISI